MLEAENRESFFGTVASDLTSTELKKLQKAYWFAKDVHHKQCRDNGERYFEHIRRTTLILIDRGIRDVDCLVVGLTHDVIEDTHVPDGVILDLFGPTVYLDVALLSKTLPSYDPVTGLIVAIGKKEISAYYQEIESRGVNAPLVKFADRMDNLSTCFCFSPERKKRYVAETEEFVIPLARRKDPWFAGKLEKLLLQVKTGK